MGPLLHEGPLYGASSSWGPLIWGLFCLSFALKRNFNEKEEGKGCQRPLSKSTHAFICYNNKEHPTTDGIRKARRASSADLLSFLFKSDIINFDI